jgi:hypothetical protein
MEDILATVPPAKRRSFAREAKALDAAATRAVLRFHLVAARKRIILGQRK